MKEFLISLASTNPFVIISEYLHWILEDDLQLILENIEFLRSTNIYFVASYRPQEFASILNRFALLRNILKSPTIQHINLQMLDITKTKTLATLVLNCENSEASFAETLYEQTVGNPFFVIKTIQNLLESGLIAIKEKTAILTPDYSLPAQLSANRDIEELIVDGYKKLDPVKKRIMEIICVASFPVTQRILKQLAPQSTDDDIKALAKRQDGRRPGTDTVPLA